MPPPSLPACCNSPQFGVPSFFSRAFMEVCFSVEPPKSKLVRGSIFVALFETFFCGTPIPNGDVPVDLWTTSWVCFWVIPSSMCVFGVGLLRISGTTSVALVAVHTSSTRRRRQQQTSVRPSDRLPCLLHVPTVIMSAPLLARPL